MIKAHAFGLASLLTLVLAPAAPVAAQQPLPDLSLEELMRIDAGRVFGASERIQPVTEAPASVSFITAEEIARYGYRTLADILRGVRGMYVTDDRNFSLLGTRGFAKPGDYNSRILLLVNGHRVNDNVFGQAEIGAEFGIDPAMFERVEIIRGPASSLYGDSAFFAVVNVITRSGASLDGVARRGRRRHIGHAVDPRQRRADVSRTVWTSRCRAHTNGAPACERLYFPAFDAPAHQQRHRRWARRRAVDQFYGQLRFKSCHLHRRIRAATAGRADGVVRHLVQRAGVGRADDRPSHAGSMSNMRTRSASRGLTLRGSFDQFSYDGTYPFAGDGGGRGIWSAATA